MGTESTKEKLAKIIAGEIALSERPGDAMKKWREMFGVSQSQLAEYLNVSSSVISDYEKGRRRSPGANTIKKFVETLIRIDEEQGGQVIRAFSKMLASEIPTDVILDMREFTRPRNGREICDAVEGVVLANEDLVDKSIYGYTVIDSIKAILKLSSDEFIRLYGWTTERALIFTGVSHGRSPMVAIRVKGIKPSMVVLHGPQEVDNVGVTLAKLERIPLVLSRISSVQEMIKNLRRLGT